jgi:hypothetical protein
LTQIIRRFLKLGIVLSFLGLILVGCQTSILESSKSLGISSENSEKQGEEPDLNFSGVLESFFSGAFDNEGKVSDIAAVRSSFTDKALEYSDFSQQNTSKNIKNAITNSYKVQAAITGLESLEAQVGVARASQAFSSNIQAVGGLSSEDRDTDLAASLRLSGNKIIYDGDSSDFRINGQLAQLKAGRIAVLVAANQAALLAYESWIDLIRYRRVNQIFEEGLTKGEAILTQIESVSVSGLSDKKGLLSSTRDYLEVQNRYIAAQAQEKIAEAKFRHAFRGVDTNSVQESPRVDFEKPKIVLTEDVLGRLALEEKYLLQEALQSQKLAFEGGKKTGCII